MHSLKTKNGYQLDEVMSAFQKSIRRGLEKNALFWALEMCPEFEHQLWARILVISYEDVSALVPGSVPAAVSVMRGDYFWFRERGNSAALLVLSNAVLLLCRSLKTRVADNFIIAMGHALDNGFRLAIPDYAIDKHTKKGKELRRGGVYFVEEGTKLDRPAEVADPYRKKAEEELCKEHVRISAFDWTHTRLKNQKLE